MMTCLIWNRMITSLRRTGKMNKRPLHTRKLKGLLAAFLSVVLALGLFPATAFGWGGGHPASSCYGATVTSADGAAYYYPTSWNFMLYHPDKTTSYGTFYGGNAYEHYMLVDSTGAYRWVYCVESGVPFGNSDSGYTSQSSTDSAYLNRLPATAQYGIKVATLYGWQPGATLPVSGINQDDWYMATQVIIWEYQQQLRSDAYSRHDNGIIAANQFFNIISGRPAERVYNWMLGKIAEHTTIPSFTRSSAASAPVHELKWDTQDKVYRLTLTDTNTININLERLAGSGVTVQRSGNNYTFTSKVMITDPMTFGYRKSIPVLDDMLIWGRGGQQTMLTGAEDPVRFYMKIKTETYGTARLIKTSEDGVVSGLSFRITGTDVLGQDVDVTVTTETDGRADNQLLPGSYLVQELPADRYVTPSAQYVSIESGQTSTVSFHNILKKFRIRLVKADADTGSAQGDGTLGGARYGIYHGGDLVDVYTTDTTGGFLSRSYICGDDWTVRELSCSEGYLLDDTVYKIGAEPTLYQVELNTTENRVTEQAIYGFIRLIKHTDDADTNVTDGEHSTDGNAGMVEQAEPGAVFEVYLRSAGSYDGAKETERDILTTDSDGIAVSKKLPYGRYTVHQVQAGPGGTNKAKVPDFTVSVSAEGNTYSYILNNDSITGRLRIEKHDAESGKIIPLSGAGFKVKDLDSDTFVAQTIYYPNPLTIDTYYTSDDGYLMLPDALPKNTNGYELIEVMAPYGYVLNLEPVFFKIDGSEAVITAALSDLPQKAKIVITKGGEVFSSVTENEGCYQPVYEEMGLAGAVYDIIADEDIVTADGTVHAQKDALVQTITTNDNAIAASDLLYLGKYRLIERQAPYGMVASTEPIYVELCYQGQEVESYESALCIYDERQKVEIGLVKSMELDEKFALGSGEEYKDVSFGLFAAYGILALDGTSIPADGLIETVSLEPAEDDSGRFSATFSTDLPLGAYYVSEIAAAKGYVLDGSRYPVFFDYAGQDIALVSLSANDGEDIANDLIRGTITGIKTGETPNGDEDRALSGALMGLFDGETEIFTIDGALLTTTTAEDGSFSFADVPFGHWVVKELLAPQGYAISPEYHHVYIGNDEQVVEINVKDNLIRGSVQLIKTEVGGAASESPFMRRVPGAVFELYADSDGDKEFSDQDELIGTLDELDGGFHQKTELLAGGYFIKEKSAPEGGYIRDESAYFFAIEEDGQVVIVENGEPGQGFVNDAYRGNLRIFKDSVDGRKDGFAFEVRSVDGTYSETFTTSSTGMIDIMDLRIGKYTVTEVRNRASLGYIIPDQASIEIETGQTVTVSFFNDKPDEPTPSSNTTEPAQGKGVPQTGDDNMALLWLALAGISLVLAIGLFLRLRKKKRAAIIALSICAAVLAACTLMLGGQYHQYSSGKDSYGKLDGYVTRPQDIKGAPEPSLPQVDFTSLKAINPDIVGWLMCEDTSIDYPIAQSADNEHYLHYLFDGTYSKVGCPFLDFENAPDFTDYNSIIYGHNLLDGSMFTDLTKYTERDFCDAHPGMLLLTPSGTNRLEIFSAFIANPSESGKDSSPWRQRFKSDDDFTAWLDQAKERSIIETAITPSAGDCVVTLCTCINGGKDRIVILGRLVPIES
jgi:SrtB family sortase